MFDNIIQKQPWPRIKNIAVLRQWDKGLLFNLL